MSRSSEPRESQAFRRNRRRDLSVARLQAVTERQDNSILCNKGRPVGSAGQTAFGSWIELPLETHTDVICKPPRTRSEIRAGISRTAQAIRCHLTGGLASSRCFRIPQLFLSDSFGRQPELTGEHSLSFGDCQLRLVFEENFPGFPTHHRNQNDLSAFWSRLRVDELHERKLRIATRGWIDPIQLLFSNGPTEISENSVNSVIVATTAATVRR